MKAIINKDNDSHCWYVKEWNIVEVEEYHPWEWYTNPDNEYIITGGCRYDKTDGKEEYNPIIEWDYLDMISEDEAREIL